MAAKVPPTATSALALQVAETAPAPTRSSGDIAGGAGSKQTLARLSEAMAELKAMAARPLLERAVTALNGEDFQGGAEWALKALEKAISISPGAKSQQTGEDDGISHVNPFRGARAEQRPSKRLERGRQRIQVVK